MSTNRVKRLLRKIENIRGNRNKKRRLSASDDDCIKGSSNMWTPKSLGDFPTTNIYNSTSRSPPAELFRKDLISAMKLPDSEPLTTDEYWFISDQWKQEWERGVQVPVNPEVLPEPVLRVLRKRDKTADFKFPKKLVRISPQDESFDNDIHHASSVLAQAEKMCRYDLDDCDLHWLTGLNDQRRNLSLSAVDESTMEIVMEELETQCYENMQKAMQSEAGLGIEYDEDVICDVCRSPDSEEGNEMVFCDSCDICVHQACYGITSIPEGSWMCRTCSLAIKPDCILCPIKGGAMKSTRSGQKWAHVSCALWIPEVSIGCTEKMEPITKIAHIPPSRWALICCLCRERIGACIQCSVKSCKTAYHVTCGFQNSLTMKVEAEVEEDGLKLFSYCPKHSKNKGSGTFSDSEGDDSNIDSLAKGLAEDKASNRAKRLYQIESTFFHCVRFSEVVVNTRVPAEVVDSIYQYWKLKRRSIFNKPLLIPRSGENDALGRQQEDGLYARMKMFVHLRQDLERVRNLCYMVSRREKLSRSWCLLREQIFHKQVAVLTDDSLDLDETGKRAVVHSCHGGTIYDQLYAYDPTCCQTENKGCGAMSSDIVTSGSASQTDKRSRSSVGEDKELLDPNGLLKLTASKLRQPGSERLPNPYAKTYFFNGSNHRSQRRSSGGMPPVRSDETSGNSTSTLAPKDGGDEDCSLTPAKVMVDVSDNCGKRSAENFREAEDEVPVCGALKLGSYVLEDVDSEEDWTENDLPLNTSSVGSSTALPTPQSGQMSIKEERDFEKTESENIRSSCHAKKRELKVESRLSVDTKGQGGSSRHTNKTERRVKPKLHNGRHSSRRRSRRLSSSTEECERGSGDESSFGPPASPRGRSDKCERRQRLSSTTSTDDKFTDSISGGSSGRHQQHRLCKAKVRFNRTMMKSPAEKAQLARDRAGAGASNDAAGAPFMDKLRQESAKVHESLFANKMKGSLVGYRIPKKSRSESDDGDAVRIEADSSPFGGSTGSHTTPMSPLPSPTLITAASPFSSPSNSTGAVAPPAVANARASRHATLAKTLSIDATRDSKSAETVKVSTPTDVTKVLRCTNVAKELPMTTQTSLVHSRSSMVNTVAFVSVTRVPLPVDLTNDSQPVKSVKLLPAAERLEMSLPITDLAKVSVLSADDAKGLPAPQVGKTRVRDSVTKTLSTASTSRISPSADLSKDSLAEEITKLSSPAESRLVSATSSASKDLPVALVSKSRARSSHAKTTASATVAKASTSVDVAKEESSKEADKSSLSTHVSKVALQTSALRVSPSVNVDKNALTIKGVKEVPAVPDVVQDIPASTQVSKVRSKNLTGKVASTSAVRRSSPSANAGKDNHSIKTLETSSFAAKIARTSLSVDLVKVDFPASISKNAISTHSSKVRARASAAKATLVGSSPAGLASPAKIAKESQILGGAKLSPSPDPSKPLALADPPKVVVSPANDVKDAPPPVHVAKSRSQTSNKKATVTRTPTPPLSADVIGPPINKPKDRPPAAHLVRARSRTSSMKESSIISAHERTPTPPLPVDILDPSIKETKNRLSAVHAARARSRSSSVKGSPVTLTPSLSDDVMGPPISEVNDRPPAHVVRARSRTSSMKGSPIAVTIAHTPSPPFPTDVTGPHIDEAKDQAPTAHVAKTHSRTPGMKGSPIAAAIVRTPTPPLSSDTIGSITDEAKDPLPVVNVSKTHSPTSSVEESPIVANPCIPTLPLCDDVSNVIDLPSGKTEIRLSAVHVSRVHSPSSIKRSSVIAAVARTPTPPLPAEVISLPTNEAKYQPSASQVSRPPSRTSSTNGSSFISSIVCTPTPPLPTGVIGSPMDEAKGQPPAAHGARTRCRTSSIKGSPIISDVACSLTTPISSDFIGVPVDEPKDRPPVTNVAMARSQTCSTKDSPSAVTAVCTPLSFFPADVIRNHQSEGSEKRNDLVNSITKPGMSKDLSKYTLPTDLPKLDSTTFPSKVKMSSSAAEGPFPAQASKSRQTRVFIAKGTLAQVVARVKSTLPINVENDNQHTESTGVLLPIDVPSTTPSTHAMNVSPVVDCVRMSPQDVIAMGLPHTDVPKVESPAVGTSDVLARNNLALVTSKEENDEVMMSAVDVGACQPVQSLDTGKSSALCDVPKIPSPSAKSVSPEITRLSTTKLAKGLPFLAVVGITPIVDIATPIPLPLASRSATLPGVTEDPAPIPGERVLAPVKISLTSSGTGERAKLLKLGEIAKQPAHVKETSSSPPENLPVCPAATTTLGVPLPVAIEVQQHSEPTLVRVPSPTSTLGEVHPECSLINSTPTSLLSSPPHPPLLSSPPRPPLTFTLPAPQNPLVVPRSPRHRSSPRKGTNDCSPSRTRHHHRRHLPEQQTPPPSPQQESKWTCSEKPSSPVPPPPRSIPSPPATEEPERRVLRHERQGDSPSTRSHRRQRRTPRAEERLKKISEAPPTPPPATVQMNGGREPGCSPRLIIKLRKDPNFPESQQWRRDCDISEPPPAAVYEFKCEPPASESPPNRIRLKLNAARVNGRRRYLRAEPVPPPSIIPPYKPYQRSSKYSMRSRTNVENSSATLGLNSTNCS